MQINQLFADKTMEAVKLLKDRKQDVLPLIWIHDYHLTLAAKYIRKVFFSEIRICKILLKSLWISGKSLKIPGFAQGSLFELLSD